MGKSFYDNNETVKDLFDRAETLRSGTLAQCFSGTAEGAAVPRRMRRNRMAQPSLRVETAPAVRLAQRGSLFSSREADSFSHAPRMPI